MATKKKKATSKKKAATPKKTAPKKKAPATKKVVSKKKAKAAPKKKAPAAKKKPAASKKAAPKKTPSANDAYQAAVDDVIAGKHKKGAPKLGLFRLDNHRKPFAGKYEDLKEFERAQVQAVLGKNVDLKSMFGKQADEDAEASEMAMMEIVDVIDTKTNKPKYQLMLWPYGDGAIVNNETTTVASYICQHGLDPVEDLGKAWTRDFGNAWLEGSKRLKLWTGHIDFSADELAGDAEDDGEG
jgi:hypothetical protein